MADQPFLISVLTDVARVLHEHRFDYALAGGLAYSALVEPRATMDIDLLIVRAAARWEVSGLLEAEARLKF